MQTPYTNIGEATEYSAFITGADGHDKASILRRTVHSYEDPAQVKVLDDDQWQALIYLIDAAPKLLEALIGLMDAPIDGGINTSDAIADARTAIDLATQGKP